MAKQKRSNSKPDFSIRKITATDISLFVEYRLLYLTELQGINAVQDHSELKNELEHYFHKALNDERFFAFLAENDTELLGFGAMVIKEIPGDFNNPTYLEGDILNMYTIPNARKKGISSAILEKLIAEAKKRGISKVALHASKDGENMYRKYGFSEPVYPYLEKILNSNFTH